VRELAVRAGLAGVPEPVLHAGLLICAALCVFAAWRTFATQDASAGEGGSAVATTAVASRSATAAPPTGSSPAVIVVDVAGAVRGPGVVRLPSGSRVADAIRAAGGALPGADTSGLNLARKLSDGEQVAVPLRGGRPTAGTGPALSTGSSVAGPTGSGSPSAGAKVDLNAADESALDALPGVGPSTAKRIVDDRTANGPFKRVEDLMRVTGIGPKKFDSLKDLVSVGP
jgi:competence protein ComEA